MRGRSGSRGARPTQGRGETANSAPPPVAPRATTPSLRYEAEPKENPARPAEPPKTAPTEGGSLLKRITGALKRSVMGEENKDAGE